MFDSDPRALIEDSLARCVPRRAILKQLVAMGLALPAASALLDACSGQAAGGSSAKVTISLWTHTHPPMIQLMKTLIKEYEARHEGVTIDYQQIPNNEFGPKMLTALSSGSGPDVINMDDVSLRGDYIPKGLVVPVDPKALGYESVEALTSRYIPGAFVGASGGDGKVYGVSLEYAAAAFGFHVDQFQGPGSILPVRSGRGATWPPWGGSWCSIRAAPWSDRASTSSTSIRGGTRTSSSCSCTRPGGTSSTRRGRPPSSPSPGRSRP